MSVMLDTLALSVIEGTNFFYAASLYDRIYIKQVELAIQNVLKNKFFSGLRKLVEFGGKLNIKTLTLLQPLMILVNN